MAGTLCFYHADCTDGAAAAAVVKSRYPAAELIAMKHGNPITVPLQGRQVFVVDFSFPAEVFESILAQATRVEWYDHHKTALEIRDKLGWGILNLEESGATLTFKQLYPDRPLPKILQYVRDKDLWEWKLPHSRAVAAAIKEIKELSDPTSALWQGYLQDLPEDVLQHLIGQGTQILEQLKNRIQKAVKNGVKLNFAGHCALAVNWTQDASDIGEYIYRDLGYPLAIIFSFTGNFWSVSLRSQLLDVADLAHRYGGGGHPGAAGFRSDQIDWLLEMAVSVGSSGQKRGFIPPDLTPS